MNWVLVAQIATIVILLRIAADIRAGLTEVIKGLESIDERLRSQ